MAPLPPDPYKILGVSKTAQIPDIRTSYRKLVLQCHPDKVQDPDLREEKLNEFQKIQQAYELLSDEKERTKYDDLVRLMELRKEAAKANSSAPRTPKPQTFNISIRADQAKASPYAQSPPRGTPKTPKGTPKPTYDYHKSSSEESFFADERGTGRTARRSPSYEKSSSRKDRDEDRDREKVREREQEEKERERAYRRRKEKEDEREERDREKDRDRRSAERETRKADKKKQDKDRKHSYDEKRHRHRSPQTYVEEYDEVEAGRSSEKKKSSRRRRDRESTPVPEVEEVEDKTSDKLNSAHTYIQESRIPSLVRAATFDSAGVRGSPPSAPTPPPPRETAYAPPLHGRAHIHGVIIADDDDEEDDYVPRSRAPPSRRNSHDPPRSKEPPVYYLSVPGSNGAPVVLMPLEPVTEMPAEAAPPPRMHKSSTFDVPRSGPRIIPKVSRSHTYTAGDSYGADPRGRSRSRHQSQLSEEEDEEEDRRRQYRHRAKREPSMEFPYSGSYGTDGGRSYGHESYRPSPPERQTKVYYNSSPRGPIVEPAHSGVHYAKVKTRKNFVHEDVNYGTYGRYA